MALIPHTYFPRSLFGTDERALNVFDPFDDLDRQMNAQLNNMFSVMQQPLMPQQPTQKYRITLDCSGCDPKALKCEIQGDTLVITGTKDGRRTFSLPDFVDRDHMASFMDKHGKHLVVDIPYKMSDGMAAFAGDSMPQMVDNGRAVNMDMRLPANIDPAHVHVTAKDHDIIVRADERQETPNGVSRVSFYRRSTMPDNADIKHMQCVYHDGNQLSVKAPLADHALPKVHHGKAIEPKVE